MAREDNESFMGSMMAFLKENFSMIVLPIIALLVLGSGIYLYSRQKASLPLGDLIKTTATTTPTAEQEKTPVVAEKKPVEKTTDTVKSDTTVTANITTADSIKQTAVKGDSMTTLARKAVKEYVTTAVSSAMRSQLSAEHKIFIEDYVRKQVSAVALQSGTSVTFSSSMISDGIAKALKLSTKQLSNLTQYTQKVTSFNLNY